MTTIKTMTILPKLSKIFGLFSILLIVSCTHSGRLKDKKDNSALDFITGTAALNQVKNVHVINIFRAIGAPFNSTTVGKYKYYNWQHLRNVGFSTLFGGGSTSLYCNLTAETQNEKIKLMIWYGNECGVLIDPISEYFEDKLNIFVVSEDEEKRQNSDKSKEVEIKNPEQKGGEQKIEIKQKIIEKSEAAQDLKAQANTTISLSEKLAD